MRLFATVFLFLMSLLAQANPVTWVIDNATWTNSYFSGGEYIIEEVGTLTGSFDYDADTNQYSNVSLISTGSTSSNKTPREYTSLNWQSELQARGSAGPCLDYTCDLWLTFAQPLTNEGGVVALTGQEFLRVPHLSKDPRWDIESGSGATIRSVPIPAAAWLFGSALAGLAWLRRR